MVSGHFKNVLPFGNESRRNSRHCNKLLTPTIHNFMYNFENSSGPNNIKLYSVHTVGPISELEDCYNFSVVSKSLHLLQDEGFTNIICTVTIVI